MKINKQLLKTIFSDPDHEIMVAAERRRKIPGAKFDWRIDLMGNKKHFTLVSDYPFSSYEEALRVGYRVAGCLKAKILDGSVG